MEQNSTWKDPLLSTVCFLIHVSGLIKIAEHFNLNLLAPRKKIVVLLIGNHSAGKSSFINW
jgi:ribosome biogenesis GTPase A